MSPYASGFSLPEGLRRHLLGWGDNVHQCKVMRAATKLAHDYGHSEFHDAEQAEEAEKRARIAERRCSEKLYRIAPDLEPELIDEGLYGTTARDEAEMTWAEQRLADLGFRVILEDNVKSYISEDEDFVVYADPRAKGDIKFTVYKKPLPKRSRVPRVRTWGLNYFRLMDTWKHDIRGKYKSRLTQAKARAK